MERMGAQHKMRPAHLRTRRNEAGRVRVHPDNQRREVARAKQHLRKPPLQQTARVGRRSPLRSRSTIMYGPRLSLPWNRLVIGKKRDPEPRQAATA